MKTLGWRTGAVVLAVSALPALASPADAPAPDALFEAPPSSFT